MRRGIAWQRQALRMTQGRASSPYRNASARIGFCAIEASSVTRRVRAS
ncbi:MAG TPA: hypothetical protein VMV87_17415 [Burkholderiales bacterium]|nr:hypothetical protein [Burkholderiales bacterium]